MIILNSSYIKTSLNISIFQLSLSSSTSTQWATKQTNFWSSERFANNCANALTLALDYYYCALPTKTMHVSSDNSNKLHTQRYFVSLYWNSLDPDIWKKERLFIQSTTPNPPARANTLGFQSKCSCGLPKVYCNNQNDLYLLLHTLSLLLTHFTLHSFCNTMHYSPYTQESNGYECFVGYKFDLKMRCKLYL